MNTDAEGWARLSGCVRSLFSGIITIVRASSTPGYSVQRVRDFTAERLDEHRALFGLGGDHALHALEDREAVGLGSRQRVTRLQQLRRGGDVLPWAR
jgi:hypothetical protein